MLILAKFVVLFRCLLRFHRVYDGVFLGWSLSSELDAKAGHGSKISS